jgi:hypothetical protein
MSNDGKPKLRGVLSDAADKVLVPKERVISSGQGCWNCKHWDQDKAKPLWTEKRQHDLTTALRIAQESRSGEQDQRVFNIRAMVNSLDHLVATKHVGVCVGGGRTANGNPVGDFVVHSFLCDRWSGVSGASLATGGKTDPLPEERAEQINGKPYKPN